MDAIPLLTVALGAIIGLILALTGAGGGILAVPMLVFGLQLTVKESAPIGLLAVGFAALLGAVLGLRKGIVRYKAALLIAALGLVAAPAGLWLAHRIPNAPLTLVFAAVLIYASQRMFRQASRDLRGVVSPRIANASPCQLNPAVGRLRWTLPCARALAGIGVLAGFLSGLLGVGGGFVIVPTLSRYTNLDIKSIIATSLAVIALVSLGSVVTAASAGLVNWTVATPFASGAVLGLLIGRLLAARLAGPRLQQAFGGVGIIVALSLIYRLY